MAQELGDIDGIGPATVEDLNDVGIQTINDLAEATVETVSSAGVSNTRAKEFINKAQQNTVIIQSGHDVRDEYESKKTISSGIERLDESIEGGFNEEDIVALYGADGSGKSQLCFKAIVEAVEQTGEDAVYIETERNRFRPSRFESLSERDDILDKVHRVKAYDLDRQENSYKAVRNEFDDVCIVVVDSLTARFRLSDEFSDRSTLPKRSKLLGRHLSRIEQMAEEVQCPVLFTTQVSGNPDSYGPNEMMYGGRLIKHTALYFIYMKSTSGEMYAANIENHPSTGDNEVVINITDNDIIGMN